LRRSFSRPGPLDVLRLRREADEDLADPPRLPELGEDVRRGFSTSSGTPRSFLSFSSEATLGRKSATAAAITIASASGAARGTASRKLVCGLDPHDLDPDGRLDRARAEHEGHMRAPRVSLGGDRDPHLALERLPTKRTGSIGSWVGRR